MIMLLTNLTVSFFCLVDRGVYAQIMQPVADGKNTLTAFTLVLVLEPLEASSSS